jgi:hypothetical protein
VTPGEDEVQLIDCTCPSDCSGYFTINFDGQTTGTIPYDATAEFIKFRMEVRGLSGSAATPSD